MGRKKKLSPGDRPSFSDQEALEFHQGHRPGKLEITPTKPMATQRDLSLAYSPGVAVPVRAISENPDLAYEYTTRGNMVAVISNGTAILGLGNLGALASKPVMEGKAVLFKRFADVDSIDLEVNTEDVDEFVAAVRHLGPSFGGINLEDIKAPECFMIEERLRELMDIPVFHDDQHGTAIISSAALINALDITGKSIQDIKLVVNGAGAAGVACLNLIKALGLPDENAIVLDRDGVLFKGRNKPLSAWQSVHESDTKIRTLSEAMVGADVFLGLSAAGAVTPEMVASMADKPIIFAMANPDPEITPEAVAKVRSDAIMATGRSDYPNQVNNVLGFPYIFRGALDVRATAINNEMKLAAAHALAKMARDDVPDEVASAYGGTQLKYGPNYIIPVPFDPRLISEIPCAVAKAAMDSGVARHPIIDLEAYGTSLKARRDPVAGSLQRIFDRVRRDPKRIVFAEGEEVQVIRAARSYVNQGFGTAFLVGRTELIQETADKAGIALDGDIQIINARGSEKREAYTEYLFTRLQRQGFLHRDCQRMVNNDRNTFAGCMVALGDADGMVTGVTRNYSVVLDNVRRVMDPPEGRRLIGVSLILGRTGPVLVADTAIAGVPTASELAEIATEAAGVARRFGIEPRVAMVSNANFGHPRGERADVVRLAVKELDKQQVDFEYDGEMTVDVALDPELHESYPFCRLSDAANVLVMPSISAASVSTKLIQSLGGVMIIGPLLVGLEHPVQLLSLNAKDSEIVNLAALTAYDLNSQ